MNGSKESKKDRRVNAGLLLTGGRSRRMGFDKALIRIGDRTLAQRTGTILTTVCPFVLEVGPGYSDLPVVHEPQPGQGPLVAIAAGWEALKGTEWEGPAIVVATDLPLLSEALLRWLADHPAAGTLVPLVDGQAQPLCARYFPAELEKAAALAAAGGRSVMALAEGAGVTRVDAGVLSAELQDVDTPADLHRLGLRA
jgi:molybdopterin-guanine dinucleotide biosynthesis protein A